MEIMYLKPSSESYLALEAIKRLSASVRRPFTYGELGDELRGELIGAGLNGVSMRWP